MATHDGAGSALATFRGLAEPGTFWSIAVPAIASLAFIALLVLVRFCVACERDWNDDEAKLQGNERCTPPEGWCRRWLCPGLVEGTPVSYKEVLCWGEFEEV